MKNFTKEFKEFIAKGNVVSMAVGIIIGGAFTKIVNSVVEQLITPLLGLICGGINFEALAITYKDTSFGVGIVISSIVTFLMTALVLFWIVKAMNRMQAEAAKYSKTGGEEPGEEKKD